jgi:UDP-N-acetylmuramoylalanine--D-glutamate ligase
MTDRYIVLGLSRSGLAACEAIARVWPQARVVATDRSEHVDRGRIAAAGAEWVGRGDAVSMVGVKALVKSPGVPDSEPTVVSARAEGVPVWSEVELASRMLQNPIVGITGTNGKTTTTELCGAMLRAGGVPVEVAGNVGRALSELPGRVSPETWIACELSSFQLEDIDSFHARVGVLLNVTPDHLDRHGTLDEYTRCKLRLFENQTPDDLAVLNRDDPALADLELPGGAAREWFAMADRDRIDFGHAHIRGDHNLQNALAAAAAARFVGVDDGAINLALREFQPPAHRMQVVAKGSGVAFVDDSKATNPDAVIKALTAYDRGVRLILGGSLKGGSFAALAEAVADGPVVQTYLIGEAADTIAAELDRAHASHVGCGDLARAVAAAAADARPGDTVLLSPACASFDQFRDYEHRGDEFARLAKGAGNGA